MKFTVPEDLKSWYAISCPTDGIRFDRRTLDLMDKNHDGRIRTDEVLDALDYLKRKGVTIAELFADHATDEAQLRKNLEKQSDLDRLAPSAEDVAAMKAWEDRGAAVACLALDQMGEANAALQAVEAVIDDFFTPPEDLPLVTEEPDRDLPLTDHLNPLHLEAILTFAEKCVKPFFGVEKTVLTRLEWKRLKAAFVPYRNWLGERPESNAVARADLKDEERLLRYRIHLGDFLRNYVTMDALYDGKGAAIFQTGMLRIDGKEIHLCFHVESEAAHAALVAKSHCCVIYLRLVHKSDNAVRSVCAVITAGTIGGLYVGRNGVFYDRDGHNWEATVTRVVEAQVSLVEAFWLPWRRLSDFVAGMVRKILGEKQTAAMQSVQAAVQDSSRSGGAALASSVAAIGIAMGMVGAALASILAAVSRMSALQVVGAVAVAILLVSLPSVIITWMNLRRRDLAAILNASGWAVNREMRFSQKLARGFTKCARTGGLFSVIVMLLVLAGITIAADLTIAFCQKNLVTVTENGGNTIHESTRK